MRKASSQIEYTKPTYSDKPPLEAALNTLTSQKNEIAYFPPPILPNVDFQVTIVR